MLVVDSKRIAVKLMIYEHYNVELIRISHILEYFGPLFRLTNYDTACEHLMEWEQNFCNFFKEDLPFRE